MKRVLIFSLAYYPHVGGAEVAVKEITDRITDIQFDMVTMRWSSDELTEEQIGNVHVYRIGSGSGKVSKFIFQFRAAWFAISLHKKNNYNGIWAMMAHSAGVPAALFKKWYSDVPYILTLQEGDPLNEIEWTMTPLWRLFMQAFTSADKVQSISSYLALWAARNGYTGKVEIIPNGVDVARFNGSPVAHVGTLLITTSRLVRKNAIDDIVRAVAMLPVSVRFQILGTGPQESALKKLVKKEKVEHRVEFVGHVDYKDIPKYLHAADIFVRPSRSEGMGNSFIEAMAAGLSVVATQVGGISDFLFDAERNPDTPTTGWAVDVGAPEQIAAQVQRILADPARTQAVVATAQKMVAQKYDWGLIAKQMRDKVFGILL